MSKFVGLVASVALSAACGDGSDAAADAAGPDGLAVPTVQVVAPNGGETLYPAQPFTVTWSAMDGATYDVAFVDGGGMATPIASDVTATSVMWTPSGVAAPTTYKVRVTAKNAAGNATDESDATFTLSPPLTGTSFARDVQPIFTANCLTQFCHTTQAQTAQLTLAPGESYRRLVGVSSVESPCMPYQRVRPGMPDQSYLVFKLAGSGPCFYGVRMPKNANALSAGNITTIRTWITEGALDN